MKMKIVAVRDRASDMFANPQYVVTVGQAIRMFSDEINRKEKDNSLNQHPEDYDLYELGEFETNDGKFETHPPKMISVGKDQLINK